MAIITPLQTNTSAGTATNCNRCGMRMRLVGIEPHITLEHTDLRTFQCMNCDAIQTLCVKTHASNIPDRADGPPGATVN